MSSVFLQRARQVQGLRRRSLTMASSRRTSRGLVAEEMAPRRDTQRHGLVPEPGTDQRRPEVTPAHSGSGTAAGHSRGLVTL